MMKFMLPKPVPQPEGDADPRPGGDSPVVSRHKTRAQRAAEEWAEARAQEEAMKLAPGNVKLLGTWENLSPAERAMKHEEADERRRALDRLNAYGPETTSDNSWIYGSDW